jgi:uncharacterized membrane protein
MIYLLLLILGVTAGLRAATPLAAIAIGAWLGWINLGGTWAAFVGNIATVTVLVLIAVAELVRDQLPGTGSRKETSSIVFRSIAGALAGVVLGLPFGNALVGLVLGIVGALIGTFGGYEVRRWLGRAFGADLPAALIEDAVTIAAALWIVYLAR